MTDVRSSKLPHSHFDTGALLRDHLCALYRTAGQLDHAQAQAVMPGTLQLAAAAIDEPTRSGISIVAR